jgi:hypothetical protein
MPEYQDRRLPTQSHAQSGRQEQYYGNFSTNNGAAFEILTDNRDHGIDISA